MGDQIKNMLVGLLMIAACAFTISLILFLKPSVGDGGKLYIVRFANINGIGVGTRVMFAGKPVGEVTTVEEIINARGQPSDSSGHLYFYQLSLKVDSSITIYNTDAVAIQTSGLLGEKSIAIIPEAPQKGIEPKAISKNQPIYASSVDPIENAFNELSELAENIEKTINYINDWLDEHGDTIGKAISSFKDTLDETKIFIHEINESQLVATTKEGISNFSLAMDRIQSSIKQLQDGKLFTNASQIMSDIADGKGTIGRLIVSDDLYLQFSSILSKGDTLMNDINHYGVLFHLNKSWQRQRLQKVTFLNSLDSPQAFRSYFESQVDEVNMAMSRLSMLIQKVESNPAKSTIFKDAQFTKDFAELLRDVDQLSNNLKLYNEQLIQAQSTAAGAS